MIQNLLHENLRAYTFSMKTILSCPTLEAVRMAKKCQMLSFLHEDTSLIILRNTFLRNKYLRSGIESTPMGAKLLILLFMDAQRKTESVVNVTVQPCKKQPVFLTSSGRHLNKRIRPSWAWPLEYFRIAIFLNIEFSYYNQKTYLNEYHTVKNRILWSRSFIL